MPRSSDAVLLELLLLHKIIQGVVNTLRLANNDGREIEQFLKVRGARRITFDHGTDQSFRFAELFNSLLRAHIFHSSLTLARRKRYPAQDSGRSIWIARATASCQ